MVESRKLESLMMMMVELRKVERLILLAKQFLGVPATSAPSERIFSAAGNIITKKRNRLKPDISSVLVFLQQSWNYMERYKEAEIEELAIRAKQSKKIIL
jgi:hypothetical protein